MNTTETLPGQDTLLACWDALATISPGAQLVRSAATVTAVFPAWAPLNNAVLTGSPDGAVAAAAEVSARYADAGVTGWALWLPSSATDLDAPDVHEVDGLSRDTTTLVMRATLTPGLRRDDRVVRTSIASATRAGEQPIAVGELEAPDRAPGLSGWVLVHDGAAVTGAWGHLHADDCGIYAVETLPEFRRRGFARALVEHVLADAQQHGARTASLQSTRMGQPVYESLGFTAAGRYEEWIPRAADPTPDEERLVRAG